MSWDDFVARHNVGDVVDGTVTRLTPFGVFLTVSGDVPGLLVTRDRPSIGSTVAVRIQELDTLNKRVAFS
ncbi:S1 RNA-binding domain-containing protein [Dactylosporangium sp. CS-033363]|uniref:S1 RNA-binding domain-containing protein n=1 Tax=Dactylosporangium sp. CS-033363 TaxID=3239935 RepID=UPI003D8C5CD8